MTDQKAKLIRARVLRNSAVFNQETNTYDDAFIPWSGGDPLGVHTTHELFECAKRNENVDIEARVICKTPKGYGFKRLDKKGFIESFETNSRKRSMREALDLFAYDMDLTTGASVGNVGQENIPLLGGPFTKQLYYYDYLRMHGQCFYAFHHDPIARAIVNMTRDFTLGRGFRVDCKNEQALTLWRMFEEANEVQNLMNYAALELSTYGEIMAWWLPNNQTKITYQLRPGQDPARSLIPRVRLIDPSAIWEIVTYPEDIQRRLFYQWVAPTQWQLYSGKDSGQPVPGTKFIVQQLPAGDVQHHVINSMSNEKRGRSDLFPALGYLKRLRDSVDYSLIAMQKQSAWAIDTTVEGSQTDIDQYVSDMNSMGTIPAAGSEFVHSAKVKREFLSNAAGKAGQQDSFNWCMNMVAAAVQIPTSYFGFEASNGATRAGAVVGTEPVNKKFQQRQLVYERIIKGLAQKLFSRFGINAEVEVTFPEIILQDRSAKMKDLALAETQGWISKERAATIAAKELGITEFEYSEESAEVSAEPPGVMNPLTAPGKQQPSGGLSGDIRQDVKQQNS